MKDLSNGDRFGEASSPVDRELSAIVAGSAVVEKLDIPAAFRVVAPVGGPKVVLFGSIHGDEPAGYLAIQALLAQFASGQLKLERGSLTLAVGNELGLEKGVREVERNLNRLFKLEPIANPTCYEERRAEALKGLLAGVDYLMDLHATSRPTPPFAMCESHLLDEARAMGFARIVTGWGELGDASLGGDTETYVNSLGGKGFTVESGQRDDPAGLAHAVDAARRLLRHAGLLTYESAADVMTATYKLFASVQVDESKFAYARPFGSFDVLADAELIGSDGEKEHRAPRNCVIIMPSAKEYMLARQES